MKTCLIFLTLALAILSGCKPKETTVTGQIFIVTRSAENIRLGSVEVLLVDKKQATDFAAKKQREIETAIASGQNELAAAEQELEVANQSTDKIDAYWSSLVAKRPWSEDINAWDYYLVLTNGFSTSNVDFENRRVQLENVLRQKDVFDRQSKTLWDQHERAVNYITDQRLSGNFTAGNGMDNLNARLDAALQARTVKFKEASACMKQLEDIISADKKKRFSELRSAQLREVDAKARLQTLQMAETFFTGFSPPVIRRTRTDADGNFSIICDRNKPFTIFASAERVLLNGTEKYFWLVNVPTDAKTAQIFLSNNNLVSVDPDGYFKIKPQ